MLTRTIKRTAVACIVVLAVASAANAQIVEAVGERALGMGGAFVAVANDSSAAWWNPAALADGPFFDLSVSRGVTERDGEFPAARDQVAGLALSTPVIGVQVWRLHVGGARLAPTEDAAGNRQNGEAPRNLRGWSATSVGATIVQTLLDGVHVGTTVKYVRGTARRDVVPSGPPGESLDAAIGLTGGDADGRLDLDLGALATAGAVRLGLLVRNARAVEFGDGAFALPRQIRAGVAISAEQAGGPPLTISLDADLRSYVANGERRQVVALGAEHWLAARRVGLRGGARIDTAGDAGRAVTAGVSVALRAGAYIEAHIVRGGAPAEQGWGTGVRVSY